MQVSSSTSIPTGSSLTLDGAAIDEVSAESLLSFLGTRLDSIDGDIGADISAIESQSKRSATTSEKRELLDQIASELRYVTQDPKEGVTLQNLKVTWRGEEMNARKALIHAELCDVVSFSKPSISGQPQHESKVTLEAIESGSSILEKQQKRLTSDNDLRMLRLQDMMNRRSQIIQMVSNFLRSIQDSQRAIVGNMR